MQQNQKRVNLLGQQHQKETMFIMKGQILIGTIGQIKQDMIRVLN